MILRLGIQAFCLNEETVSAVKELAEERLLIRSTIEAQLGGTAKAVEVLSDGKTPDVIIVETTAENDALFEELDLLANVCEPGTRLLLIGVQNDIALFRELMGMGVSEYLITPVTTEQLRDSITAAFKDDQSDRNARMIGVIGARGGSGSSVIAHNLAVELAQDYDSQVIIIDFDVYFGTAALAFNVQPQQTVVDALSQSNRLDPALLERFLVEVDDKISVLAAPANLGSDAKITAESVDALTSIVRQMTDFVILDLPHRWEPWVLEALVHADEVVLITEPDLASLRNTKNLLELFSSKRGKSARTRLIFNQAGKSTKTELSKSNFKKTVNVDPDVVIPYDPDLFGTAFNNGEIAVTMNAKSKVTLAIRSLAELVSGRAPVEKPKKSLFSFIK